MSPLVLLLQNIMGRLKVVFGMIIAK